MGGRSGRRICCAKMKRAAQRSLDGSGFSTFLGQCFEHGLRFKKDIEQAKHHYRKGVKFRSGVSAYRLALILTRGPKGAFAFPSTSKISTCFSELQPRWG